MNIATFDIAMWHPFGPHGLESADQILERKKKEISANGWTLWSFQYRRPEVLAAWSAELTRSARPAVFCSSSKNAVDPAATGFATTSDACKRFRFINETQWRPFPSAIRSPHPFRKKKYASAFIIQEICIPEDNSKLPAVEWLSKGEWRQDRLPTRGEYLIRSGGILPPRKVRSVLILRPPFLAMVSAEDCSS